MKTKIAIVITSLLFVAGLIFQSSLTQFILVRSLTAMCSSQIGAALTYEDVKAQNGRYVLHGVRIAPKEARGGSGWVLSGDQLSIGLQPRWLKGRVDIDLQLAGGRFEVPQGVVLALPKPSTEGLLLGLLRKEWRVRADDAHLALLGRNAADATETLLVNVEAMGGATQHLHLQFLSEAEGRSGTAESWMDFLPERSLLSVRCVDVDLAPLYRLSQVCGMQPGDFRVSHGRLSGAFALEKRPKGHWLPIESGSLQADKLLVGMASGQFQCQVPELALQLQPTQNAKDSCVRLECKKGASLTHYRDRQLVASVHQLQGQLDLRADYSLDARLKGLFHQGRDPRDLFLSLETEPLLAKHFAADISLRLETDGKRDFGGRLRVEQIDSTAHWEGSVQNLRAAEWNLAASYIQDNIPHLADFHIHQGGIDGEFAFKVLPSGLQSARLQSLFVRDLQGDWGDPQLHFRLHSVSGALSYDMRAPTLLDGLETDLTISDATVNLQRSGDSPLVVNDLDGVLSVHDGGIAESDIKMSAGGLRLHFKTSEPGSTEPGSLVVQGDLESLLPFVSPDHREGLRTQSKGVQVFVHAEGSALSAGLAHVKATAELRDPVDGALHALHSTFDLEKSSAPAHRASSSSRSSYEQCADAMAFCGLKLSHGAFWAKSLPIARYLAPCLSTRQSMTAQGLFDLSGTFEGGHIIARFNARDIALDSPSLHLELPSVGQRGADPSDYDAFAGVYHLDFLRDQNYGYFPLHGARLSLKNSGASFDALEGSVSLEGQELFVKKLSTEADGVHIEGRLRLDVAPCAGRNAQIEIHTDRIEGKLSDATRLLERFSQGRRSTLPLDGRLLCERPAFIRLQIEDAGVGVEAQVQGELLDGVLSFDIPGVQVEGIATEFAYDHQRRTLAFPKLRGRILVGNGAQVDEYTLRARHLRVYGFPDSQADFDLRIEGRTRDLVRLVGNTAMAPEFGRDAIHIAFDRAHTYFGTIQPNVNRLVLKNWKELLEFHAEPTANVANLIGDLERIARSGSFICGPEFFAHLRDHDVAGEAITTVSRSAGSQQTTFDIRGDQIRFDGHSFSSVQIAGRLEPGHWTVDQLQLDELNVSAELRAHENGTRVDFLGLRYGDALLAGMEGEYKSEAGSFEGLVNVLDIDLSKAEALPGFPSELIGAGLTGRIHAKGIAKADLMAEAPYIRCGARLESDLKQFSIFSVPFSPSKGLVLQVQSDRGLSIEQSAIAVDHQHLGLAPLGILVDRVHYDFQTESLEVNGAQFRIPAKNLPWLASTLHAHCPKIVNTKRQEMISQLLSSGQLQGSLSFEAAPTVHSWAIELAEGEYHFANDTHYLRSLALKNGVDGAHLHLDYRYRNHYYTADVSSQFPGLNSGSVRVCDTEPFGQSAASSLKLAWDWPSGEDFKVRTVDGSCAGISAHLQLMDQPGMGDVLVLGGSIQADVEQASKLLPPELESSVKKFRVGRGYELSGRWEFSRKKLGDFAFEGVLGGKEFQLTDYRLRSLFAHVDYRDGALDLRNVRVSDVAGEFAADQIRLQRNQLDEWLLNVPLFTVSDFRPSLLRDASGNTQKPRPLMVSRLDLHDLKGRIADPSSFTATGSFSFVNPSKANIQNTILMIPSDILARIGLDLDLLTPVVGSVYYDIHDSRVHFTQFKDVYSEGRVSRFFLAGPNQPSYLDFDGNLNVKVRMKQYNLIFKLAELFTISVRGDVGHPSYSLQKLNEGHETVEEEVLDDAAA